MHDSNLNYRQLSMLALSAPPALVSGSHLCKVFPFQLPYHCIGVSVFVGLFLKNVLHLSEGFLFACFFNNRKMEYKHLQL